MIKHFCDICGKELIEANTVSDVTLLTGVMCAQFCTLPTQENNCELCITCANTLIDTIKQMKRGRGVVYVEKN